MLNALNSYLQNSPYSQHPVSAPTSTSEVEDSSNAAKTGRQGGYVPSARAIMVSAVASDFDVRALERQEIGPLQVKLQQYGLLSGRNLDAFSLISTQATSSTDEPVIDALQLIDQAADKFDERHTPYSERQGINYLHRLLHNLDSARQLLKT